MNILDWRQIRLPTSMKIGVGIILLAIILLCSVVDVVETGEAGVSWNPFSGTIALQSPGVYFTSPLTLVTKIETRPQRVCIPSATQAGVDCRLVQFDTNHLKEFIAVEGWHYYWLYNRVSFNSGYTTYRGFRDVLRGYAFSVQQYPFIKVLEG